MKKIISLVIILALIGSLCFAEDLANPVTDNAANAVVNMQYTVHFDGYEREGLYTGALNNGVPEGFGVFVTHNKNGVEWHYIGQWHNGQFSGEGAQYWEIGQVSKGQYAENDMLSGYCGWSGTLLTMWLDDYDENNNRHFVTYYPGSLEKKYCEGYADETKEEVISVIWYDKDGNTVDVPESLTITAIAYMD